MHISESLVSVLSVIRSSTCNHQKCCNTKITKFSKLTAVSHMSLLTTNIWADASQSRVMIPFSILIAGSARTSAHASEVFDALNLHVEMVKPLYNRYDTNMLGFSKFPNIDTNTFPSCWGALRPPQPPFFKVGRGFASPEPPMAGSGPWLSRRN